MLCLRTILIPIKSTMPKDNHLSTFTRNAVTELQQYMDKHPVTHKTCGDLWSGVSFPNRTILEFFFKEVTGYGVKEYLVFIRLEYSKQYLRKGWPVKRVAVKALYKSQSAYCTAFKRYYNQTPTNWLKEEQS